MPHYREIRGKFPTIVHSGPVFSLNSGRHPRARCEPDIDRRSRRPIHCVGSRLDGSLQTSFVRVDGHGPVIAGCMLWLLNIDEKELSIWREAGSAGSAPGSFANFGIATGVVDLAIGTDAPDMRWWPHLLRVVVLGGNQVSPRGQGDVVGHGQMERSVTCFHSVNVSDWI